MSKIILITGSNTGVGLDLARVLAEKNHKVYISARNEMSGKEALGTLHSEGLTSVKLILLDVTKVSSIEAARAQIEAEEGYLDVLVNNAGICYIHEDQTAPTGAMDIFRSTMETNFYGAVQTTTAFLPLLRKSKLSPIILNVSSELGSNTFMSTSEIGHEYAAYNASKAALNSYTIALAHDLKPEGIKANVVSPGYVATRLNDFNDRAGPLRNGTESLLPWVLVGSDGPTGKFFTQKGVEFAW